MRPEQVERVLARWPAAGRLENVESATRIVGDAAFGCSADLIARLRHQSGRPPPAARLVTFVYRFDYRSGPTASSFLGPPFLTMVCP